MNSVVHNECLFTFILISFPFHHSKGEKERKERRTKCSRMNRTNNEWNHKLDKFSNPSQFDGVPFPTLGKRWYPTWLDSGSWGYLVSYVRSSLPVGICLISYLRILVKIVRLVCYDPSIRIVVRDSVLLVVSWSPHLERHSSTSHLLAPQGKVRGEWTNLYHSKYKRTLS